MRDGTTRDHDLIFAPDSPPFLRASQIASAEVFLLSKWTEKSSVPALMSILPTPSAPSNALLTAETQPPQMGLPSSNLAWVSVATELVAGAFVFVSAGASAVQPARMRAHTPTVINRIMVSLGKWDPRRTSAGPLSLSQKRRQTHVACLATLGSPTFVPVGSVGRVEWST